MLIESAEQIQDSKKQMLNHDRRDLGKCDPSRDGNLLRELLGRLAWVRHGQNTVLHRCLDLLRLQITTVSLKVG